MGPELCTLVVARHWRDRRSELTYVTRSIAGAASRVGQVRVLAPGSPGSLEPDGAFDVEGMGEDGDPHWPTGPGRDTVAMADELTSEVAALVSATDPRVTFYLSAPTGVTTSGCHQVRCVPGRERNSAGAVHVPVYVPVNLLALQHRHHGFGFTGYHLVLAGGPSRGGVRLPAEAAWLSAAFPAADVVVVQDALAAAWRGRALRGTVPVDTRMDLCRLIAHALFCVDLCPGSHIARECVEALRLGTPIIVPSNSGPAAAHAAAGGGRTYGDAGELIESASELSDPHVHAAAAAAGRRYADEWYGNPTRAITDLGALLTKGSQASLSQ